MALELLCDSPTVHFRELHETSTQDTAVAELFAYGNYALYTKYKDQLPEIPPSGRAKLVRLLLLELCQQSEHSAIAVDELLARHSLRDAVTAEELEAELMKMVDCGLIEAKVDHRSDTVAFERALVPVEVYGGARLVLLSNDDVAGRSVDGARSTLQRWLAVLELSRRLLAD